MSGLVPVKVMYMADTVPPNLGRGRPGSAWSDLAASIQSAGQRAARLDRRDANFSKKARAQIKAAGLAVGTRKVDGEKQVWVWLLDEDS